MIKHVIYGFFGLLGASVIALAIYLDKPVGEAPLAAATSTEESSLQDQTAAAVEAESGEEQYQVSKVIDGDTLTILKAGSSETIRMIGINAPETGQCFSTEATEQLKKLIAGGTVSLEKDATQGERDKYDRLLAYVFTDSGVNTAEALIKGGFAKEYTYSKTYKYQKEFKEAQVSAQTAEKGLWASGACQPTSPVVVPQTVAAPVVQPVTKAKTPEAAPNGLHDEASPEEEEEKVVEKEAAEDEEEEEDLSSVDNSGYTCSTNTYNCPDFKTHAEAQAVFEACGGKSNDVHQLDRDKDGQVCEGLP